MWKLLVRIRSVIIGLVAGGIIAACATIPTGELVKSQDLENYRIFVLDVVNDHCTPDQYYSKVPMVIGFSGSDQVGNSIAVTRTSFNLLFQPISFRIGFEPDNWAFSNHEDKVQLMAHEMMHAIFRERDWYSEDTRYHFMHYTQYYLPLDKIMVQLHTYLKEKCE